MKTELLRRTKADIQKAAELLRQGQVVGIPTETVYGLAANALDADAVLRIFEAKGRPQDNPLIIHISSMEQLEELVEEVSPAVYRMAEQFWPGPLTMVLKKKAIIPDRTSAGLDTVGIRMPSHPVARAIIEAAGLPLAAPSANTSGKPSPTTARDVLDDMAGKIPAIVDGGACTVGVESTVVDMTGDHPQVLRPGAITEEMIAEAMGQATTDRATLEGLSDDAKVRSPGMKYRHYAPRASLVLLDGAEEAVLLRLQQLSAKECVGILCYDEEIPLLQGKATLFAIGARADLQTQAHRLFSALREADAHPSLTKLYAHLPEKQGLGLALYNRCIRAAAHTVETIE